MERPTHLGLRHLALNAHRLEEMKRFYVDLLGFSVEWEPDADNIYLSSGSDNLALHRSADIQSGGWEAEFVPSTLDHLGLLVGEADDVDRWALFLESRGVRIDTKPRTHRDGARSCYFHDPDGNSVQIIYHPPISGKL
jgi:catechol 2,3-dioxygenase-like lactoylglutathione lyase family enzyme